MVMAIAYGKKKKNYRVAFTVYATVELEAKNKDEAETKAKEYMNGKANFVDHKDFYTTIKETECNDVFKI